MSYVYERFGNGKGNNNDLKLTSMSLDEGLISQAPASIFPSVFREEETSCFARQVRGCCCNFDTLVPMIAVFLGKQSLIHK